MVVKLGVPWDFSQLQLALSCSVPRQVSLWSKRLEAVVENCSSGGVHTAQPQSPQSTHWTTGSIRRRQAVGHAGQLGREVVHQHLDYLVVGGVCYLGQRYQVAGKCEGGDLTEAEQQSLLLPSIGDFLVLQEVLQMLGPQLPFFGLLQAKLQE